ncbi:MAG: DUF4080 domain-containing protein, partial [Kiritimatiellaeota bacterium]|nr:DUF4080 domain-containing protein [Kiritimatiellota bacterium]
IDLSRLKSTLVENGQCGIVHAPPPSLETVALPYSFYTQEDIDHRILYVETSRGCPFRCMYCTSAGHAPMRFFPQDKLLGELDAVLRRGARRLKFLDRSFNHNGDHGLAVLDFLLAHPMTTDARNRGTPFQFHFEFTPYALTEAWRERLCRFAPGELHIEVGIQAWNTAVTARLHRPCSLETADETLRFLIHEARADVHADLIVGLPGETEESIHNGFNHLARLSPSELQVGILKRLPGTELARRYREWNLCFSDDPPYEVLQTDTLPFETLCRLKRFAQCWDRLYNRRRFPEAMRLLLTETPSPFHAVSAVAQWLHAKHGRLHALSPKQLAHALLATHPSPEMARALKAVTG